MNTSINSVSSSALSGVASRPSTPDPRLLDFPIAWEEEHAVTRRNFMSFVLLLSTTLLIGTGVLGLVSWLRRKSAAQFAPALIASVHDVSVGSAKLFSYPTAHDPCLLIRLSQDLFVAYSQKCTHLSCPVTYKVQEKEFFCPCHAGRFALADGRVLGGPPQRPLPRILINVSGDEIWATGIQV